MREKEREREDPSKEKDESDISVRKNGRGDAQPGIIELDEGKVLSNDESQRRLGILPLDSYTRT